MVKLQNVKDKKILKSNQRNDTLPIKEETTVWLTVDFSSENNQVSSKWGEKQLSARIPKPIKVPHKSRSKTKTFPDKDRSSHSDLYWKNLFRVAKEGVME